ncbi:MAG: 3-phosphoshikimate 1-carboxyvinyltransferase, partial [Gemmatimonadetes bacterium]|nr:3-phosphoshikimate 1-carboxyvinyltransferase [Gemmatimonadota bacterium]NIR41263.1 3-phosphoshikimate 1-carboxyvinyltransferase [Actinomycetota bacterium]NIS36267.1 3-phosphoshikimate 1-carboxyvinyltransferase [Actinomycetota bacterium]NIT98624.1 3-phosphoshikimate 1-carboxyvinyltransferase [Actinomycetota bacterium]NIU70819.1 3-phosphoshikimate 1-carboxyvinyltransferase [Actinomycetota bacterium]
AVAALVPGATTVDGTARMRMRPIEPLAGALRALGVPVETTDGNPPLTVRGGRLGGGEVEIDGSVSSQFVSALL